MSNSLSGASCYHCDGNGNVTCLVNSNQLVVASYAYDPFGTVLRQSGPMAASNLYRCSSKEWHENSGLVYYLYRFYDPGLQRSLNRDPIGERGGINLYRYARNDPVVRSDAFGHADSPKEQPPATISPPINPPSFGGKPFRPGTDNCLCYAMDRPGAEMQPDGKYGFDNAKKCPALMPQLKDNYAAIRVPESGSCPAGLHKAAVSADGDGGYHVQRQDSDGNWSEMSLGGRKDTYPPRKCKRGDAPGKDCGDICLPDAPKMP